MKVGITERGDAGVDFSWEKKLLPANIIISKDLNDKLIEKLVEHKDKVIFHMTCTGFGSSKLEPNVKSPVYTKEQFNKLINAGFPVNQVVLRIDPIIPVNWGIDVLNNMLQYFSDTGIKRVRYSFLDLYPHVKERFKQEGVALPYNTFCASDEMIANALNVIEKYSSIYEFEACAENTPHKLGCISNKDLSILGIESDEEPCGFQRKGCLCIAGKTELLTNKTRCKHKCLYCYWKD